MSNGSRLVPWAQTDGRTDGRTDMHDESFPQFGKRTAEVNRHPVYNHGSHSRHMTAAVVTLFHFINLFTRRANKLLNMLR